MAIKSSPKPEESTAPLIEKLDRPACERVLAGQTVGRLAFTLHDRVDVVPLHFVYENGWVYGRMSPGGKLLTLLRNHSVAFEVDERRALFDWKSVVVHGPLYFIDPPEAGQHVQAYEHAIELLRRLLPDTLGEGDPVPFRTQIFTIRASEMSGRQASPTGGEITPADGLPLQDRDRVPEADADLFERVSVAVSRVIGASARSVHIEASDGVVVLVGSVDSSSRRVAIEDAVKDVKGVVVIVQQLETDWPEHVQPTPAEVGQSALHALRSEPSLALAPLTVVVENGWLRVEGTVANITQREAAMRALRDLHGASGVLDRIQIASS